jgi:RND family efflux transporter MFP subunit
LESLLVASTADLSGLSINREPARPAPRRSRRLLGGIAVAFTVVALAAVAVVATRERPLEVSVARAEARGGGSGGGTGISANGYVVARTKASISSRLAGRLAYLGVEEGDQVKAGAVIARLESSEYEAAVSQARADVATAEATRHEAGAARAQAERALVRARDLAGKQLIAPQAREDAETSLEMAEARQQAAVARWQAATHALSAAEALLENTRVRAPFDGTVLRKDAEVGEVVAPSVGGGLTRGAVVTMADLTTLEVEVDVNEAYIAGISDGQPADIVLDAYPSESFRGHVRQVVPTADRQKATVLVRVAIDSKDSRILPEMGARVVFREPAATAGAQSAPAVTRVFVPAGAVKTEGEEVVVYVVQEERAVRRVIEAGPVSGGEREIRQGLAGGETLVLEPPAELQDGARVRVVAPSPR